MIPNQRVKYRSETGTIFDIINEVKDKKEKVVEPKMLVIIRLSQDTLYGQVHMHQVH